MAMSVVYTTFDGEIVHENRGGVASFYAPDTMGSTVALLNSAGVVTDTYSYWPYGEIQSHVGSSQTPFGFLGTIGYYLDVIGSFLYVRARYLRQALARWQTVDRLWPRQAAYQYVRSAPTSHRDPSGRAPCPSVSGGRLEPQSKPCIWGNYCGPCDGNGGRSDPVDAMDKCCQAHDQCLHSVWNWINIFHLDDCQCTLCACMINAQCQQPGPCGAERAAIIAWACIGCVNIIGVL